MPLPTPCWCKRIYLPPDVLPTWAMTVLILCFLLVYRTITSGFPPPHQTDSQTPPHQTDSQTVPSLLLCTPVARRKSVEACTGIQQSACSKYERTRGTRTASRNSRQHRPVLVFVPVALFLEASHACVQYRTGGCIGYHNPGAYCRLLIFKARVFFAYVKLYRDSVFMCFDAEPRTVASTGPCIGLAFFLLRAILQRIPRTAVFVQNRAATK